MSTPPSLKSTPLAVDGIPRVDLAAYSTIGMVASSWSEFEKQVDVALCRLAGISLPMGLCLILQIQSTRQKLIALEAIVSARKGSKEHIKKIRRFSNELERPTRMRNKLVHTPVTWDDDNRKMVSHFASADRTLTLQTQDFDLSAAIAFGRAVHVIRRKFAALAIEIEEGLPPLPEIPPLPPLQTLFAPYPEEQTP